MPNRGANSNGSSEPEPPLFSASSKSHKRKRTVHLNNGYHAAKLLVLNNLGQCDCAMTGSPRQKVKAKRCEMRLMVASFCL